VARHTCGYIDRAYNAARDEARIAAFYMAHFDGRRGVNEGRQVILQCGCSGGFSGQRA
jgi:hypothetical protein